MAVQMTMPFLVEPGTISCWVGMGDDYLYADDIAGYATRPEGRDYADGGEGDDWASGGLGDDVLLGGMGKDRLYGDNAPVSDAYVWTDLPWVHADGRTSSSSKDSHSVSSLGDTLDSFP